VPARRADITIRRAHRSNENASSDLNEAELRELEALL
jgi:hypothetical protein